MDSGMRNTGAKKADVRAMRIRFTAMGSYEVIMGKSVRSFERLLLSEMREGMRYEGVCGVEGEEGRQEQEQGRVCCH